MASLLRAARALVGWSRADLARHAGVSEQTIGEIETGRHPLDDGEAGLVRRTLEGVGVEFLGDDDAPGLRLHRAREAEHGIPPEDLNAANDD